MALTIFDTFTVEADTSSISLTNIPFGDNFALGIRYDMWMSSTAVTNLTIDDGINSTASKPASRCFLSGTVDQSIANSTLPIWQLNFASEYRTVGDLLIYGYGGSNKIKYWNNNVIVDTYNENNNRNLVVELCGSDIGTALTYDHNYKFFFYNFTFSTPATLNLSFNKTSGQYRAGSSLVIYEVFA